MSSSHTQAQAQPFKTDSLLPTSLPSATLGRRRHLVSTNQTQSGADDENLTTEERAQKILDAEHEKWNERIDKEIKGVVDGLNDLVELADIGTAPSPLIASTLPLHLPLRTSSLIRSAQNIRDIAHELKLLLVLGDETSTVQRRDAEMDLLRRDIAQRRGEVIKEFGGLLGVAGNQNQSQSQRQTQNQNQEKDVMDTSTQDPAIPSDTTINSTSTSTVIQDQQNNIPPTSIPASVPVPGHSPSADQAQSLSTENNQATDHTNRIESSTTPLPGPESEFMEIDKDHSNNQADQADIHEDEDEDDFEEVS
ncbi:uncharacterized protein I303_100955 [Kwoniella dejecticola CBS 10117]|uniref:Uncharacterized protein n=1 Tax=Kwoniella dejecticola CBS 10117 TaxID=1296121 RepID=A0A1A6AGF1_9TREE|nr:uncharacterized protein I303_00959 [Kwoniella dejecticola CBS 10117]OBR89137.1 hypothetical protein I303_00959 [Kwoniella dejecticola CBS 10117]